MSQSRWCPLFLFALVAHSSLLVTFFLVVALGARQPSLRHRKKLIQVNDISHKCGLSGVPTPAATDSKLFVTPTLPSGASSDVVRKRRSDMLVDLQHVVNKAVDRGDFRVSSLLIDLQFRLEGYDIKPGFAGHSVQLLRDGIYDRVPYLETGAQCSVDDE
ncbi:hypothetical protein BDZ89DRAFT_1111416, partial [Hymenopellis radicata]